MGRAAARARAQGGRQRAGGARRRQYARALAMARWVPVLAALLAVVAAARKAPPPRAEPQIEEVTAKQLERVLDDKDYVAVFWCKCAVALCNRGDNKTRADRGGRRRRLKWRRHSLLAVPSPQGRRAPTRARLAG